MDVFLHFRKPEGHPLPRAIEFATGIPKGSNRVTKVIQKVGRNIDVFGPSLDDFFGAGRMPSEKGGQIENVGIDHHPKSLAVGIVVFTDFLKAEECCCCWCCTITHSLCRCEEKWTGVWCGIVGGEGIGNGRSKK